MVRVLGVRILALVSRVRGPEIVIKVIVVIVLILGAFLMVNTVDLLAPWYRLHFVGLLLVPLVLVK